MNQPQQHFDATNTKKQKKMNLVSRLNPFNWMGNNKGGAGNAQGNDMSIDEGQDDSYGTEKNYATSPIASSGVRIDGLSENAKVLMMSQQKNLRMLDNFYIDETLGSGMSGKVKKGIHVTTGQQVALKIIDRASARKRVLSQLHTEIMAMKSLKHPNILNLLHVSLNATYPRKCGETRQVMVIGLELARGGELFDFMMYTGSFSEILARTFFLQMLNALSLCHSKNIYHRDIKPENLLLDERFQLKLADFGLAAIRNDKEELLRTECGTRSYMAPEILEHKEYDGSKADVWSCAVVLFIMLAGNPPFTMAKKGDWWFNALLDNNYAKFWRAHLKYAPQIPQAAMDFLTTVFIPDPKARPSVDEVLQHPWCKGPIYSNDDLYQELLRRKSTVDEEKAMEKEAAKREKEAKKGKQFDPFQQQTARSTGLEITEGEVEVCKYDPSVTAPILERQIAGFTNFYTAAPALAVLDELKTALVMLGGNTKIKDDFTIKCTFSKDGQRCDIKIDIYSMPNDKIQLVDIQRKQGDPFMFNKIYKEILEKIPYLLVNSGKKFDPQNSMPTPPEDKMLVEEVDMI